MATTDGAPVFRRAPIELKLNRVVDRDMGSTEITSDRPTEAGAAVNGLKKQSAPATFSSTDDGPNRRFNVAHHPFPRFGDLLKPLVGSPWPGNGRKQQNEEAASDANFDGSLLLPQVTAGFKNGTNG